MDHNSHVFWYYIHLCQWFPVNTPERVAAFTAAHHEILPHLNLVGLSDEQEDRLFCYLLDDLEAA